MFYSNGLHELVLHLLYFGNFDGFAALTYSLFSELNSICRSSIISGVESVDPDASPVPLSPLLLRCVALFIPSLQIGNQTVGKHAQRLMTSCLALLLYTC